MDETIDAPVLPCWHCEMSDLRDQLDLCEMKRLEEQAQRKATP